MSFSITGQAPYGTFVFGTKVGESEEFSGVVPAGETVEFASIKRWNTASAPTVLSEQDEKGGPSDGGAASGE